MPEQNDFSPESGDRFPVDPIPANYFVKDPAFFVVLALGALPLVVVSFESTSFRLNGMILLFALFWGWVFRDSLTKGVGGFLYPMLAFFFTGIAGLRFLLWTYRALPDSFVNLPHDGNSMVSLLGHIARTGFLEELCKLLPVILYLAEKRNRISPLTIIMIGVFSGLGFAAFENIQFSNHIIESGMLGIINDAFHVDGLRTSESVGKGASLAMTVVLLRSLSLVFVHGVFGGISAYYLAAALGGRHIILFLLLALSVSPVLHGVYDWACTINLVAAAGVVAFSFMLFYGYLYVLLHPTATKPPCPGTS